ncbi:MAG: nitroreductase/quinone reductase family protein [Acidimicrobiales bacterium]
MPTDQHVDMLWETPTHEEIIGLTKSHVEAMETMAIDEVWVQAGMHHVMIKTIGRKSGKEHKIALPYWRDPEGVRVVVASFAGHEKHPSWFINLRDRDANPEIYIKVQDGEFYSVPDILEEGPEHARIWELLCEDRAWYRDYQKKTNRTIPLVRLPETRSI